MGRMPGVETEGEPGSPSSTKIAAMREIRKVEVWVRWPSGGKGRRGRPPGGFLRDHVFFVRTFERCAFRSRSKETWVAEERRPPSNRCNGIHPDHKRIDRLYTTPKRRPLACPCGYTSQPVCSNGYGPQPLGWLGFSIRRTSKRKGTAELHQRSAGNLQPPPSTGKHVPSNGSRWIDCAHVIGARNPCLPLVFQHPHGEESGAKGNVPRR